MLATKHIRLRAIEEGDLPTLAEWKNDPEINNFFHEFTPISLSEQKTWYEDQLRNNKEINLVAVSPENKLIGTAGFMHIDARSRKAVLARIMIGKKGNRGSGIGAQILLLMLQYAYDHLNINKLYGEVLVSNKTAVDYYKSFGFKEEGIFRDHVFKNGNYQDVVSLALFRKEYNHSKEQGIIKKLMERYI